VAEPFKNSFNPQMISRMGEHLERAAGEMKFDRVGFVEFCLEGIEQRELKQRSNRIVDGLQKFLPYDFLATAQILSSSLDPATDTPLDAGEIVPEAKGIRGWAIMPMADYVGSFGHEYIEESLVLLRELTSRWSAEFGIRPFLRDHPQQTLDILDSWVRDKNEHVRRLISEGTRPRLPWGLRLHGFVRDPAPVIKLLEQLKDDKSEYVRRSVANNLNDIAKDHPALVADIARRWLKGASKERKRLVRHALRSLIKQGDAGALAALGYNKAKVLVKNFEIVTPVVMLGAFLEFELYMVSNSSSDQPLIIDYVVHHQKANGKTSPKVFKWKGLLLKSGQSIRAPKRHGIKPITTRKYYRGKHRVEILVNGTIVCGHDFELQLA